METISDIILAFDREASEMDGRPYWGYTYGWSYDSGWTTRTVAGQHFCWLRVATHGVACDGIWVPSRPKTEWARQWYRRRHAAVQAALPELPIPNRMSGAFMELIDEFQRPMWELKMIASHDFHSAKSVEDAGIEWNRSMPRFWRFQRELRSMGL